jgi:pepF/M3 family oligoendopeptidase
MALDPLPEKDAPGDWDMRPYFPSFGGREYQSFRGALQADIAALASPAASLPPLGTNPEGFAAQLVRFESVGTRAWHLGSYLGCLSAADSRDEAIQGEVAALASANAQLGKAFCPVYDALRDASEPELARLLAQRSLAGCAHFLERERYVARFRMPLAEERLAADLSVDGIDAWGRLYSRVAGELEFELRAPGREPERLPVALARSLYEDPDPGLRRAALAGANAAWQSVGATVAACLNAISGTRLTLLARRGVAHFLDDAVFDAGIERRTLDAMWSAVRERREVARACLRHKAKALGLARLGFQDLHAPARRDAPAPLAFDAARERLLTAFEKRYPAFAAFAADAFARRWIDHSPRSGKRPGGFCSSSPLLNESRIFVTFRGGPKDVSTLAHELGHAFHSHLLREQRAWARGSPMTLAETASTFAEQLAIEARLEDPATPADERSELLEQRIGDAALMLLDIPARFEFEHAVYERRAHGELSVSALCERMRAAQLEWFGDALDPEQLDPWFWASKLHFYIVGTSFYNYPYTFGYLFSRALFERARAEGPSFLPRYEQLLQMTGSATPERCAQEALGVDVGSPAFWNDAIDGVVRDLAAV